MSRERLSQRAASVKDKTKADTKKQQNGELRDIGDFEYDTKHAKVLKKALHSINVSLGTLLSAMKELAMLRGSDITPDGKLGGKGFIMSFREMKSSLNSSISELSDITDTIADELTNPKWGLSKTEVKSIKEVKDKVEEKAEEAEEIVEESPMEESSKEESITPDDVKDSVEVLALSKYKSLMEGPPSKDKTAKDLSKSILANLVRGE